MNYANGSVMQKTKRKGFSPLRRLKVFMFVRMEEAIMKRILVALPAVFALSIAFAGPSSVDLPFDPSPETTVTCWRGAISTFSAPGEIMGQSQCQPWSASTCADCIVSLEQNGCKVIRAIDRQPYDTEGVQLLDLPTKLRVMGRAEHKCAPVH